VPQQLDINMLMMVMIFLKRSSHRWTIALDFCPSVAGKRVQGKLFYMDDIIFNSPPDIKAVSLLHELLNCVETMDERDSQKIFMKIFILMLKRESVGDSFSIKFIKFLEEGQASRKT
jgi:hypothetical protein